MAELRHHDVTLLPKFIIILNNIKNTFNIITQKLFFTAKSYCKEINISNFNAYLNSLRISCVTYSFEL